MTVDFAIIGAQKAATSSLQAALRQERGVYMPVGESAFFEEPDFGRRPWESFKPSNEDHLLAGIKRPDYLCLPHIPERFAANCPESRFIVVVRDPISRAVSALYHLMRHGHIPLTGLNEGIERAIDEARAERGTAVASVVTFGLYGRGLHRWHQHYPADRFLVLDQKRLATDPLHALNQCRAHLGLEESTKQPPPAKPQNRGFYRSSLVRLYRTGHLLKTQPLPDTNRRIDRSSLARRLGGSLLTAAADQLGQLDGHQPVLNPDLSAELATVYRQDGGLLGELTGRNYPWASDAAEGGDQ